MKIYRLYVSKVLLSFYFLMFGVMTVFGIVVATAPIFGTNLFGPDGMPWQVGIVWLIGLSWIWYTYLRIPFEIKVLDDDSIQFRSLLKLTTISPKEIKSLKAQPALIGFLKLKHSKGTINFLSQMDNFHEFVSILKTLNPKIEIRGC